MLSIGFRGCFIGESSTNENWNGAIWKFEYICNNNTEPFTYIDLKEPLYTFNMKKTVVGSSEESSEGRTSLQYGPGDIKIQVTEEGYTVTGSEITTDIKINVDKANKNQNSFGFFSSHHGHSCNQIGYFSLENIIIRAKNK